MMRRLGGGAGEEVERLRDGTTEGVVVIGRMRVLERKEMVGVTAGRRKVQKRRRRRTR